MYLCLYFGPVALITNKDILYVNGSGSITSVGGERANLSAVVYL